MAIFQTENMKYQNLIWTNTVFEYESPLCSTKVSNSAASQLTVVYTYIYIPNTSAVNKTVNYLGDLPRGRTTDDKSDCSNGISIRGRLYVYSMYTLWGSWMYSRHIGRFTSNQCEGLEGVGVGRIHPPQIDWNCSLADISFLMVRGSFRQTVGCTLHAVRGQPRCFAFGWVRLGQFSPGYIRQTALVCLRKAVGEWGKDEQRRRASCLELISKLLRRAPLILRLSYRSIGGRVTSTIGICEKY